MAENEIAKGIVDAAFKIHSQLDPGLLESVYEAILVAELEKRGFRVARQQAIPVVYEQLHLETGSRADVIVEGQGIIEIKSVEELAIVHKKLVLTYLRLANKRLGLLINFNVALKKDGMMRIVNNLQD